MKSVKCERKDMIPMMRFFFLFLFLVLSLRVKLLLGCKIISLVDSMNGSVKILSDSAMALMVIQYSVNLLQSRAQ